MFARRGFSVQSLTVGPSERPGSSRITMVVPGDQSVGIDNMRKQVLKLVAVEDMVDLKDRPSVHRELMLIKVRATAAQRGEIKDLADIFHGDIVDVSPTTVTIEMTGREQKIGAFQDLCEEYGVIEVARTGRVALARDSGVDTPFLEGRSRGKVML